MDFDWDAANIGEIAKHRLGAADVEEALNDRGQIGRPAYVRHGELRAAMIGVTAGGRVLVVVITHREGRIRVVTSWPARGRDLRDYRNANP